MNRDQKNSIFFPFVFLLVFFTKCDFAFSAPDFCGQEIQIKGESSHACEKAYKKYLTGKYRECTYTHWLIRLNDTLNRCHADVMNRELDKRLLPLKEKDPVQFAKEMTLQKEFNEAVKKFCDRYAECGGTMYQYVVPSCYAGLNQYRTDQAIQVNKNQLVLPNEVVTAKWSKDFKGFAEQFTVYPEEVWKGKKIPSNRTERVLSEIEKVIQVKGDDLCALE